MVLVIPLLSSKVACLCKCREPYSSMCTNLLLHQLTVAPTYCCTNLLLHQLTVASTYCCTNMSLALDIELPQSTSQINVAPFYFQQYESYRESYGALCLCMYVACMAPRIFQQYKSYRSNGALYVCVRAHAWLVFIVAVCAHESRFMPAWWCYAELTYICTREKKVCTCVHVKRKCVCMYEKSELMSECICMHASTCT